jgi:hypothetical protein
LYYFGVVDGVGNGVSDIVGVGVTVAGSKDNGGVSVPEGVSVGVGVGVGVGKVLQSYTLTIVPPLLVLIDNCSVDTD